MKYVLQVAEAKAEQQRVEAQGVSDFNKAVSQSLTPAILEYERIQQLTRLADSTNAKTVLIGASAAQTPVLLQADAPARDGPARLTPDT